MVLKTSTLGRNGFKNNYLAVQGGLMSLYQDSHERVWMQCWRDTTDGVGSMVRAIENTSEGRTTHNDTLQP